MIDFKLLCQFITILELRIIEELSTIELIRIDQNWTELNILLKLSCNSEMYQNINDKKLFIFTIFLFSFIILKIIYLIINLIWFSNTLFDSIYIKIEKINHKIYLHNLIKRKKWNIIYNVNFPLKSKTFKTI